jgi:ferritin
MIGGEKLLKPTVLKALNDQLNAEYRSAYLYLGMSAYADNIGFKGSSNWLWHQAREEMSHASKLLRYILDQGGKAEFHDVKSPDASFGSLRDVFTQVAAHEREISDLVDALADLAMKERDHATYNLMLWYVSEQLEEVSTADDVLNKVKAVGDNVGLLYNLDAILGQRQGG